MQNRKEIVKEILDVIIKYKLTLSQAEEILHLVANQFGSTFIATKKED